MLLTCAVLSTDGKGYWSSAVKKVTVVGLELAWSDEDFGELRVFFDKNTWNVNKDGLIYTDRTFIKELRQQLTEMNLKVSDVTYSEQGMQGDDYVSCDVGPEFISSFKALTA